MRKTRLAKLFIMLSLFTSACAGEPAAEDGTTTLASDKHARVELKNGVSIEFEESDDHELSVQVTGPVGTEASLDDLIKNTATLSETYRAANPNGEVPDFIAANDTRIVDEDVDVEEIVAPNAAVFAKDVDPKLDEAAIGPKSAVGTWSNTWCDYERVKPRDIRGDWWWKRDVCLENRTNDTQHSLYGVRQGAIVVQSYRGAMTLKEYSRAYDPTDTTPFVLRATYEVTQGNWVWRRRFSATRLDVRFQLVNATNDGYHILTQSARTPISTRPALKSGGSTTFEWIHYSCGCTDNNFQNAIIDAEGCINNIGGSDLAGRIQLMCNSAICGQLKSTIGNQTVSWTAWEANGPNPLEYEPLSLSCTQNLSNIFHNCADANDNYRCNCGGACPGSLRGI